VNTITPPLSAGIYNVVATVVDPAGNRALDPTIGELIISGERFSNTAPLAGDDEFDTNEDVTLNIAAPGLLLNDRGPEGDALTITGVDTTGTQGTVIWSADGSLTYLPAGDYYGQDRFEYFLSDGRGGSATGHVQITVHPVNDAPVHTVPAAQTIDEDSPLVFSAAAGNPIAVADVDAGGGLLQQALTATQGTVTLSRTTGLTFTAGDGTGDAAMTFTGTLANINAALDGLVFIPAANYNGAGGRLVIVTNDNGSFGSGGSKSDTDTITITVNAVNDPPVHSVPNTQVTTEGVDILFSTTRNNLISVSDVDAGSNLLQQTLSVAHGTLTLSRLTGLTFVTGDGTDDAVMQFRGTAANINAALAGMRYCPAAGYNGPDSLTITTGDQGYSGSGGAQSDTDIVALSVKAINQPPVHTLPTLTPIDEDTVLVFSAAAGNPISVTDPDSGTAPIRQTLQAVNGTLTLGRTDGLTFLAGDGTDDALLVFTGAVADINAALDGLTFAPLPDFYSSALIQLQTEDLGWTGEGGPRSANDTLFIIINPMSDGLIVDEFMPTATGFTVHFSLPLATGTLNLYSSLAPALGPADVTLVGASSGPVRGSFVISEADRRITFVQTGGLLAADTYTVTVRSGTNGFQDTTGALLDGNADGAPGDDYTATFSVAVSSDRVVSIPDMARGAGQAVNVPNAVAGLPIRIDNAAGVTAIGVEVVYRASLLEITDAVLAVGLPDDWTVEPLSTRIEGATKVTTVSAHGTTPLSGSNLDVVRLTAAVPDEAPYGDSQAIRLENVSLNGGDIAAVGDVAIHKAVYLGDADGSGVHSSADAFLTVQAALGLATGFSAHAWTDPRIVGDADGSGMLSAADAFLIVQEGLGLPEPFVPDNPHIGITPVGGGVDPQFRIDVNLPVSDGGVVTVPVKLDIDPAATNVGAFDFDLFFDPAILTIQLPGGVSAGADTAGWAVTAKLVAPGQLRVGMVSSRGRPLAVGLREIGRLQFRVKDGESSGMDFQPVLDESKTRPALLRPITDVWDGSETHPALLDIEPVDARAGGYTWTAVDGSVAVAAAGVNDLNRQRDAVRLPLASAAVPVRYDGVNKDGACTTRDLVLAVNRLNARNLPEREAGFGRPAVGAVLRSGDRSTTGDWQPDPAGLETSLDDIAADIASAWGRGRTMGANRETRRP